MENQSAGRTNNGDVIVIKYNCVLSITDWSYAHKVLMEAFHDMSFGWKVGRERRQSQITSRRYIIGGPAAAPTLILGPTGFTFALSESGVRKILLAPESTIAILRLSSLRWQRNANYLFNLSHLLGDLVGGTSSGGTLCDSGLVGGLQLEGETNDMALLTVTRLQC